MITPTVSTLKSICKRLRVDKGAIQILFDKDGSFAVVSYGVNKNECNRMKCVANIIWDMIDEESIKVWD
jgi:hypothetical protein